LLRRTAWLLERRFDRQERARLRFAQWLAAAGGLFEWPDSL
jgi:hypothetical protein